MADLLPDHSPFCNIAGSIATVGLAQFSAISLSCVGFSFHATAKSGRMRDAGFGATDASGANSPLRKPRLHRKGASGAR
jgi:hypothetical protein